MTPNIPEEQHTFVPVLFRKKQESLYSYSRFSYSRIAPPRMLAVAPGQSNRGVRALLAAMGADLLELVGADAEYDIASDVDIYGLDEGTPLPEDSEQLICGAQ